jgi:hypothetical protein
MLARFDEHLRDGCGLREATREITIRQLERVLGERFGSGPVDLACWIAEENRDAKGRLLIRPDGLARGV